MKHNFYIIFSGALISVGMYLLTQAHDSRTVQYAGLKLDTLFDNQKAQDAVRERVMNELLHPPAAMSSSGEDEPVIHLRKNH
jgi:hypothetical protein